MLPELRMFQEMMENILISLGQPVVKGNERPPRPFLNANTQSYIPERRNLHSEFYGAIPLPLEQEDGINLLQGERSRFMQQAATQVSPPGDMQDSLFFTPRSTPPCERREDAPCETQGYGSSSAPGDLVTNVMVVGEAGSDRVTGNAKMSAGYTSDVTASIRVGHEEAGDGGGALKARDPHLEHLPEVRFRESFDENTLWKSYITQHRLVRGSEGLPLCRVFAYENDMGN